MKILGIDPGSKDYAWALYVEDGDSMDVEKWGTCAVDQLPDCQLHGLACVAIEEVQSYGNMIGKTTLDTCRNSGSIGQMLKFATGKNVLMISRKTVAANLTGSARSGDKQINSVVSRLCPAFRGKRKGIDGHHRAAVAVAMCAVGELKRRSLKENTR